MWKKYLFIIFLFCFFALLQNSFFTHFTLFGTVPNLVFALFFLLLFFAAKNEGYQVVCWTILAGFFLDIFSYTYIGPAIILLAIIAILFKKAQSSLKIREDNHPLIYFLPLFVVSFSLYELLMGTYLELLNYGKIMASFDVKIIFSIIYTGIFATTFYYIFKKMSPEKNKF